MKTLSMSGIKPIFVRLGLQFWMVALISLSSARAAVVFTTLHAFQVFTNGANPQGLVQGRDGYFYGTTGYGGTNGGWGTVFKISPDGALTTLYSFTGGIDGCGPQGLVQGNDGNFYGTTGINNRSSSHGTVYKITTNGALTTLYSFTGGNDGSNPSGLVQGSLGDFYGTTVSGYGYTTTNGTVFNGTVLNGTVFKISAQGVLTTLYTFTAGSNDGAFPNAGLVQGRDGYFYGTTEYDDCFLVGLYYTPVGGGTVFKISATGTLTTLYSFPWYTNGDGEMVFPNGAYADGGDVSSSATPRLVQGSDGYFYGTTDYADGNEWGTVFKITTNGALTTMYSFTGGNDGGTPVAGLVQGSDGWLYGATYNGGTNGNGTVFKISTNGALTSLYLFGSITNASGDALDGANPFAALALGSDGYFYGTTGYSAAYADANEWGTVFKITTNGALTTLYSFTGPNDGVYPQGLMQGSDGNFYGTTKFGGTDRNGTVFQMKPGGALTTLVSLDNGIGEYPEAPLVQGRDGNFYGTTWGGGFGFFGPGGLSDGSVFKMTSAGVVTQLVSFNGFIGSLPNGLVQGSDGNFYGSTQAGGTNSSGTVIRISPNGDPSTLYFFTGGNDGSSPNGLMQGSDGNFCGTTQGAGTNGDGTVFQLSTNGILTTLYSFAAPPYYGVGPTGNLVQGSDGYFYGCTWGGGTNNGGSVFKIDISGALTTMYSFTGYDDGGDPKAGLVQGSDGYFYGTTEYGGTFIDRTGNSYGTLFKITTNGTLTTLYSFTGGNDGASPEAALVQGTDGSFYGTTSSGGGGGAGTVFRLTIVPEIQAVTLTNSMLSLAWSTEPGGSYQLQYSSDLSSSNWANVGPPVAATGATLSTTDTVTNGPQRFYRLALSP